MFRALVLATLLTFVPLTTADAGRPNLLIITVDDMSADSMGTFGCPLKGTSPAMDALAESGLRFKMAHVQVGNCMPSRNVMWSGRYPHTNGVEGFYQVKQARHQMLSDLLQDAGYFVSIRGKVNHSTPYQPYAWDRVIETDSDGKPAALKNPKSYGDSAAIGIAAATEAGKPFCVMINVSDPHKPFYGQGANGKQFVPTKVFTADEVPIPGFLFDDPGVREELALYYSSVRRADDCVREILAALDDSGQTDETIVFFLSDHGMPLPFAKTQLYHHSTRTPLVVRWPGVTQAGSVDDEHMVSAIDFLPTLLDIVGVKDPDGLQGRSFAPLLKGARQTDRDYVFKEYNENAGRSRDPMRGVQSKRFLYLFNPWSNGSRVFATATTGTQTYKRLVARAKDDPALAARLDLYKHRVPEELYDVVNDPDCTRNLIDSPQHAEVLAELRAELEAWMVRTDDPMLPVFRDRENAEAREAFVQKQEVEAATRGGRKRKQAGKNKSKSK